MISKNLFVGTTAITIFCSIYMLYKWNRKEEKCEEKCEERVIDLDDIENIVEKVTSDNENSDDVVHNNFNFNYSCCEPISTSIELLELLNCDKKIYNFYELIWSINNYLYEHELLELQFVTLNDEIKKLLSIDDIQTLPYHIFIENILKTHVNKYI